MQLREPPPAPLPTRQAVGLLATVPPHRHPYPGARYDVAAECSLRHASSSCARKREISCLFDRRERSGAQNSRRACCISETSTAHIQITVSY